MKYEHNPVLPNVTAGKRDPPRVRRVAVQRHLEEIGALVVAGDCFDLSADHGTGGAAAVTFAVRGRPLTYRAGKRELSFGDRSTSVQPDAAGRLKLRLLIDRRSLRSVCRRRCGRNVPLLRSDRRIPAAGASR